MLNHVDERAKRLVENNVIMNVSRLISWAIERDDSFVECYSECLDRFDYEEAAVDDFEERMGDSELLDGVFVWATGDEEPDSIVRRSDLINIVREQARAYCNEFDIDLDNYRIEALEFYAVSENLAGDLEDLDEPTAFIEDWSMHVWGRTCSGQAVYLDSCIREIAEPKPVSSPLPTDREQEISFLDWTIKHTQVAGTFFYFLKRDFWEGWRRFNSLFAIEDYFTAKDAIHAKAELISRINKGEI